MFASRECAGVAQIAVPSEARACSTLSRIDYADAFLLSLQRPAERTPLRWARMVLEDAPAPTRARLLSGWSMLGLRLDCSPATVLGWQIRRSTADYVLLGAESRIGMPGQLLFTRRPDGLLFDTFVGQHNVLARGMWASVQATHVRVVREILEDAGRRAAR